MSQTPGRTPKQKRGRESDTPSQGDGTPVHTTSSLENRRTYGLAEGEVGLSLDDVLHKKRSSHKGRKNTLEFQGAAAGEGGVDSLESIKPTDALFYSKLVTADDAFSSVMSKFKCRTEKCEKLFDWSDLKSKIEGHTTGPFWFLQPRQTEMLLEPDGLDAEVVPFFIIFESTESTLDSAKAKCPTHYVTKEALPNMDAEDYVPETYQSLEANGFQWARLEHAGSPLNVFLLRDSKAAEEKKINWFSATPPASSTATTTTTPAPVSFGSFGGQPVAPSAPVSFGGTFGGQAVASAPASFGGSFGGQPVASAPVSFGGTFGGQAVASAPVSFGGTFGGQAVASAPVSFGGQAASSAPPASFGGGQSLPVATAASRPPLSEINLILWSKAIVKDSPWKNSMRIVICPAFKPFSKLIMDNDKADIETVAIENLQKLWLKGGANEDDAQKRAKANLSWFNGCPVMLPDKLQDGLSKHIAKVNLEAREESATWASLSEEYLEKIIEALTQARNLRNSHRQKQLHILDAVQRGIVSKDILVRDQWVVTKFCPSNAVLKFRVDRKIPGLGDPDHCFPAPYVFRNPFLDR